MATAWSATRPTTRSGGRFPTISRRSTIRGPGASAARVQVATVSLTPSGLPMPEQDRERAARRAVARGLLRGCARGAGAHDLADLRSDGLARDDRDVPRAGARHGLVRRLRIRRARRLPETTPGGEPSEARD